MHREQLGSCSGADGGHGREVAPLADVDDALEHRSSLARPHGLPAERVRPPGTVAVVNLGAPELIIVLLVILVLFGGSQLPKLARSLGQAQSEFKQGMKDTKSEDEDEPTS